ncbi:MAG: glycosyltransferase family 4 protein, partial [Bacteroidota bacterium]
YPHVKSKIRIVGNVINDLFFIRKRKEKKTPSVLFVSRIVEGKGIFDFLEAIPLILKENRESTFCIVGDGEDRLKLEQLIERMGLGTYVAIVGGVNNERIVEYLRSNWVLVFPTKLPEGMPMVLAEALAAGTPIVTTETRFSASYLKDRRNCLVARRNDPQDLARKINAVLRNKRLRVGIAGKGKDVAEIFRKESVVPQYTSLYQSMLQERM